MNNFKELKVWQKAIALVTKIYQDTQLFPKEEIYGITSQMRRAACSIPMNISEGSGRKTSADFCRFLDMARGSANELETQLIISLNLMYLPEDKFSELNTELDEIQRMIRGLQNSLETHNS